MCGKKIGISMNIIFPCIISCIYCVKYNFISNFSRLNLKNKKFCTIKDSTKFQLDSTNLPLNSPYLSQNSLVTQCDLDKSNSTNGLVRIITPPPNVTGDLHVGNLLNLVCSDVYKNYLKLKGFKVNINFSNDHAGQSFQKIFESHHQSSSQNLAYSGNSVTSGNSVNIPNSTSDKLDLALLMCKNIRNRHVDDIRRLGIDWDYGHFTLDKHVESLANKVLQHFQSQGLLTEKYWPTPSVPTGNNFTPISAADIYYTNENVNLYGLNIKFQAVDELIDVKLCTQFPEFYLATTAVAVPNPIFTLLKHKYADLPKINRKVPIIPMSNINTTLSQSVKDMNLGILLSNGFSDYHDPDQPIHNILHNSDTTISGVGLENLKQNVMDILRPLGTVTVNSARYHDNSKVYIIPQLQYVLDTKTLSKKALEVLERIKVYPETRKSMIYNRLKNIKDWCITRNAWWGLKLSNTMEMSSTDNRVLDTWFTSSLWPIVTHPSDKVDRTVLFTCYDILEHWIVKMLLICANVDDKKLFDEVYLHGMVSDQFGKKMSKSHQNTLILKDLINLEQSNSYDQSLFSCSDPDDMIRSNLVRLKLCSICSFSDFTQPLNSTFNYQNILFKYYQIFKFHNNTSHSVSSSHTNTSHTVNSYNTNSSHTVIGSDVVENLISNRLLKLCVKMEENLEKFEFSNAVTNLNEYVKIFSDFLIPLIRLTLQLNLRKIEHFNSYFTDLTSIMYPFTPTFVQSFKLNTFTKWPRNSTVDEESDSLFDELVNVITTLRKSVKDGENNVNISINAKLLDEFTRNYINNLLQLTYNKVPNIIYNVI